MAATRANVLGILSLIFWSLVIVICIKYLAFVTRADNRGEGGILSLMSLLRTKEEKRRWVLTAIGLFGAALLYGDGMIQPVMSVLSAVEGLTVATPVFEPYVVPITITILIGLFATQRLGTAGVGALFGPVTLIWFVVISILGMRQIIAAPVVLTAVWPWYGVEFFLENRWHGFLALGAVFLVVTGGESLYADMGHFGRRPIRVSWYVVVLPALLLNYFGQGAFLLLNPRGTENPFFLMAPHWALYPLVILAAAATSIASQAVISGSFSLTRQAVQLGYMPRVDIKHTSAREIGQIYIPGINWTLMLCTIGLVLGFRTSTNVAAAYGVAVTTTMVITTVLLYFVARERWGWSRAIAVPLALFFLIPDVAFFGANILKVPDGGWFPLVVATVIFGLMTTWQTGRRILNERLREGSLPDQLFMSSVAAHSPVRVPGTAVFMDRTPDMTPHALLHNIKHNKVLHDRVVLLTVLSEEKPHIEEADRTEVRDLGHGVYRLIARYGYMESPDIPDLLSKITHPALTFDPAQTTYFLGRENLIPSRRPGMAIWREKLFVSMTRNATSATRFYCIPPNRVVELGAQVEL